MPEDNPIFRKVALDRLSSPEQLDQLMKVTSPKAWTALLAMGVLLIIALLWGIFGHIPTTVSGQGILMRDIQEVVSPASGEVEEITKQGRDVQLNDIVAVIRQPELKLQIQQAEQELSELSEKNEQFSASEQQAKDIDMSSMTQEEIDLRKAIQNYDEIIQFKQKALTNRETLSAAGVITPNDVLTTKIDLISAQQSQAQAKLQLTKLQSSKVDRPLQLQQLRSARHQRIADTERLLALYKKRLALTSEVRSPYAGKVVELVVERGNYVSSGTRLLTLESKGGNLMGIIFAPAEEGKRIKKLFPVQISPSTFKKEEEGTMKGEVTYISDIPVTPERMTRLLRNPDLIRQLSGQGAAFEIGVSLKKDTNGHYVWTSSKTNLVVESGTLCTASIEITNFPPIKLVLPFLKGSAGL